MTIHAPIDTRIAERQEYSSEFLNALAEEAKRSADHWNTWAAKKDGFVAESWRGIAGQYASLRWSALSALEGCPESIAELNDYFETDHLNLFRDVSLKSLAQKECVR